MDMDMLALECELASLEMDAAMEGLFRSKENVEKADQMKPVDLLKYFVEKKGADYFLNDKEELKKLLAAQNVGDYKIVKVDDVLFGIVDDGAYFVTKGRKGSKLTNADLKKLQKNASRMMTKADRKENGFPFKKKKPAEESIFDFDSYDDIDFGMESDFDFDFL